MKRGGGRQKGARFERQVAEMIVAAFGFERKDCYRTPLSGGHRFASKSDPGDLVLSPALRELFPFSIECKHYKEITLQSVMEQLPEKRGPVWGWWAQAVRATMAPLQTLLVFRMNNGVAYCLFCEEHEWMDTVDALRLCHPYIRMRIDGQTYRICAFAKFLHAVGGE